LAQTKRWLESYIANMSQRTHSSFYCSCVERSLREEFPNIQAFKPPIRKPSPVWNLILIYFYSFFSGFLVFSIFL